MATTISTPLPRQRLPYSQKTKTWRKNVMDHADGHSIYHNGMVRKTLHNKIINLNLYNGIVDVRDIHKTLNPFGMDASYVPDNIPHHPIMVPKIDLLVGEEINRQFDFTAIVTNPDAISAKEEEKSKFVKERFTEFIKSTGEDPQEIERKLKELEKDIHSWQDKKELLANRILRHYWEEQEFSKTFTECFKDVLINAEEIVQVDIENNEPVLNKLNGMKVHAIRNGNSNRIEDSDLIILEDHWSPGRIVDVFHEELKPKDIDTILEYSTARSTDSYTDDDSNHLFLRDGIGGDNTVDPYLGIGEVNGFNFSSNFTDPEGNIRVLRVYWKSLKKMQKIKYYDEMGDVQTKLRSEEYIIDKEAGEESTTLWVNEAWEGTKIGKDIYINMRPRRVQYSKMMNPSYNHFGIIGEVFNTNQSRAVSLVDRMKNYQYMYDVLWDRTNKGIQKNYGKILELDLARVPDNWEIEKWMHFAVVNGIAVTDSFKEANKGAATGKLAGNMQQSKGYLDLETGAYIQQHISLLEYIKMEMGEISGVSKQREGQISNRETASGIERSVNQSSHITEWWFMKHENFKKRCLTAFLDTAKIAFKDNPKKAQYILDDQSIEILNIDEEFTDADYGIVITSSQKTKELENTMKQLAQSFMQNGGNFSTVMDIYLSPSLADMRRKIEGVENDIKESERLQAEQQNKIAEAQLKALQESEQATRDLKKYEIDTRATTDIQKAIISATGSMDDGIENPIESIKVDLDRQKMMNDHMEKIKALNQDMLMHKDKMVIEEKKIQAAKNKPASKS
ncbi:portal protein [Cellulophaga phage phi14:2]|uniref:Structural protein n=1 Tax=Cellulophaga phage phi14:2 TaxID=1327990 RepID=S0A3H8_9CAUD|nr:portal protein [Cellulophaga phage phi14:2]AGO48982.1 structural protein [Cellulophaga phage phi14:2]